MTYTINLFDELLSRARRLHDAGLRREAAAALRRLLGLRGLPAAVLGEAHARLGEILLKRRLYQEARRHLRAALRRRPDSARLYFLLGLALHVDPKGNKDRAARCYARSLEIAPTQLRCRGEAGLLAVETGRAEEGLALLREAVRQAPGDAGAVGRLVKGLLLCGRREEAASAVQEARFSAPRCDRLLKLWHDLRLAGVRREQELSLAACEVEGPTLLPFVPPAEAAGVAAGWRQDGAVALPGPHLVGVHARSARRAP
jgi:tetratricopeptide (TPR) repeat protein